MSGASERLFFDGDFLRERSPPATRAEKRSVCEIQVSRGSGIAEELERAIDRKDPVTVVPS
ncbi:ATPase [Natrinema mahii]|nr:ATPase [Natrinema mahii]